MTDRSTATVPPLAKYLASTDKKTRDKAVKNLSIFLSNSDHALPPLEMAKLWKGIFYCFWMSDKPFVQQALASELAELVLTIATISSTLAFLRGFWESSVREWNGIDRLRIDKYYMLVRRFVNASFRLLIRTKWDKAVCEEYNEILLSQGGPLCPSDPRVPAGLLFHLTDMYLEELDKALAKSTTEGNIPAPVPIALVIRPFLTIAARTPNSMNYKRIQASVIEPLLSALESSSPRDDDRPQKRARLSEEAEPLSNITSNACFEESQTEGVVPVDVLRKKILRALFEVASQPDARDSSRRKMYKLWKGGVEDEDEDEDDNDI